MANYARLSQTDIDKILRNYQIGTLDSFSNMKGGQANSSYIVNTVQGRFILSICDEKNNEEVNNLVKILKYLESMDYPTSRLVETCKNTDFITWSDKPAYIKKHLDGDVIKEIDPNQLMQVGKAIAQLHKIPPLKTMPDQFPYGFDAFNQVIETGIEHSYLSWLKEKKETLLSSLDSSMKKGFIHGDIFWDNLLFLNDNLIAVLDFEEACQYYHLFDIGMAAVGCCSENGQFNMAKITDLIQGYQSDLKLTSLEQKQLKIFIDYAAVAASFWRFRQYNINNPDNNLKDYHLELTSLADQIHNMSESEFFELVF